MSKFSEYWDKKLPQNAIQNTYEPWLKEKLGMISQAGSPILDLGSGNGEDTEFLLRKGFKVISADFSKSSVEKVSQIEGSTPILFDMSNIDEWSKFPDKSIGTVVANLSLHYFDDKTTRMIMEQIKRILKPSGILIARVNSSNDKNFGASDGEELEPGYYTNPERGINKRFFTPDSIKKYFSIVGQETFETKQILFNGKPKQIFEIVCGSGPSLENADLSFTNQ